MTLAWTPREPPLAAVALVAFGDDAALLCARLLRLDEKTLGHLRGVVGTGLLAVLGPHDWLPWSPGVQYLGAPTAAPGLLLPTVVAPDVPLPLLLLSLQSRFPDVPLPLACLPGHVFSVADAAPLTHAALEAR